VRGNKLCRAFSVHKFTATAEEQGAMSRTRDVKTEVSVRSKVRLLNGSRRLAEVSVFPSASCLRRSVSAPEIPCLRRAHAMSSGYGNMSVRRTHREPGWATAACLCRVDITGRPRSFTVRMISGSNASRSGAYK